MLCRRCKKNKIESAGLCPECHVVVLEGTNLQAHRNLSARVEARRERPLTRNIIYSPIVLGRSGAAMFLCFFLLILFVDPAHSFGNSFLLAIAAVSGSFAGIALCLLVLEIVIECTSHSSTQERVLPGNYKGAKFFYQVLPHIFTIVGGGTIIALISTGFASLNWTPLADVLLNKDSAKEQAGAESGEPKPKTPEALPSRH